MMAPNGTRSPALPAGHRPMRLLRGREGSLMARCDRILLGSIVIHYQSARVRAEGEAGVAQLRELGRVGAREGVVR